MPCLRAEQRDLIVAASPSRPTYESLLASNFPYLERREEKRPVGRVARGVFVFCPEKRKIQTRQQ